MNKVLSFLFYILLMSACHSASDFKNGDILFRGEKNGSLSTAIDEVTQTGQDHHFSHMGVVELVKGEVMVWHATPGKGVVCESIDTFCLANETDSIVLAHFRIKSISDQSIAKALEIAHKLKGQPYDYTYILESEGYYCSEFVYNLFEQDSIFQLDPMTFIDPTSGDFHNGWIEHYRKMGLEIPEGQPGCNPNGMAASDKIKLISYIVE